MSYELLKPWPLSDHFPSNKNRHFDASQHDCEVAHLVLWLILKSPRFCFALTLFIQNLEFRNKVHKNNFLNVKINLLCL